MGSRLSILAGLLAGLLVAGALLLGVVYMGPDPTGDAGAVHGARLFDGAVDGAGLFDGAGLVDGAGLSDATAAGADGWAGTGPM